MKRVLKVLGVLVGIFVAFLVIVYIHFFVWPFDKANPNFSHVEEVFNRMQFPSDWKLISESENNGLHGRRCEFESSTACFHKAVLFEVTPDIDISLVSSILQQAGCTSVNSTLTEPVGGDPYRQFSCQPGGGVSAGAEIEYEKNKTTLYVTIGT